MPEKIYRTRTGFKVACWVLAVLCTALVVLFPFAVAMLWLAYRAQVRIADDKLTVRWFGTREIPWGDLAGFKWAPAAGVAGAMLRPLTYELRSKPKAAPRIAIGAYQGSDEILGELTRRTGLALGA